MKSTSTFRLFLTILIVALVFPGLSACASAISAGPTQSELPTVKASVYGLPGEGNVLAIGMMDTLRYMNGVINSTIPSAFVYGSKDMENFVLCWPMPSSQWGFFGITKSGVPINILNMIGNRASTMTFTDLINGLTENGWTTVDPSELPSWLTIAVGSTAAFLAQFSKAALSAPLFIIIPGTGPFDPTSPIQD